MEDALEKICDFGPCDYPRSNRGMLCAAHAAQRRRGKQLGPVKRRVTGIERFWSKVEKTDTCWNWVAGHSGTGYGIYHYEGITQPAHRVSYEMHKGKIPEGILIDHICHNKSCVNPGHLRLATTKQNMENLSGPKVTSTSGVRGVYWHALTGKWNVQVGHNRRRYSGGLFHDLDEAEAVAKALRNQLYTHNNLDRPAA
jgi:hypothetical protein